MARTLRKWSNLDTLKAGAPIVGNTANGVRLYADGCVPCHGLSGEGVEGLGSTLRPSDVPPKAQFLFLQHCATCHGLKGEGQDDVPALVGNEFVQTNDEAGLLALITNGRPNTPMEGFSEKLSEDEILQIIPLLKSWQ